MKKDPVKEHLKDLRHATRSMDREDIKAAAQEKTLAASITKLAKEQRLDLCKAKAKELARLVKFWRKRASHGAAFDAAELAAIRAALPGAPDNLAGARLALAHAIAEDAIPFETAVQLCHSRTTFETEAMREAMGGLATTWYDDLPERG